MSAAQLFIKSDRIEQAVELINKLPDPKFPLLLNRILQKFDTKEDVFTEEEIAKLEVALSVTQDELALILQTLTFIFQQAAYHVAKPTVLNQQLQKIGIDEIKSNVISQTWLENAATITEKIKKKSVLPKQLLDVNWELRLQLAQSTRLKQKIPLGLVEMTVGSVEHSDKLLMEFNHAELYSFYQQLETIQSQLDALR